MVRGKWRLSSWWVNHAAVLGTSKYSSSRRPHFECRMRCVLKTRLVLTKLDEIRMPQAAWRNVDIFTLCFLAEHSTFVSLLLQPVFLGKQKLMPEFVKLSSKPRTRPPRVGCHSCDQRAVLARSIQTGHRHICEA